MGIRKGPRRKPQWERMTKKKHTRERIKTNSLRSLGPSDPCPFGGHVARPSGDPTLRRPLAGPTLKGGPRCHAPCYDGVLVPSTVIIGPLSRYPTHPLHTGSNVELYWICPRHHYIAENPGGRVVLQRPDRAPRGNALQHHPPRLWYEEWPG